MKVAGDFVSNNLQLTKVRREACTTSLPLTEVAGDAGGTNLRSTEVTTKTITTAFLLTEVARPS